MEPNLPLRRGWTLRGAKRGPQALSHTPHTPSFRLEWAKPTSFHGKKRVQSRLKDQCGFRCTRGNCIKKMNSHSFVPRPSKGRRGLGLAGLRTPSPFSAVILRTGLSSSRPTPQHRISHTNVPHQHIPKGRDQGIVGRNEIICRHLPQLPVLQLRTRQPRRGSPISGTESS